MSNYIPYHIHTEYSLLDSCTKPSEYIELCKEYGIKAISFSEHGKISNWTEKWAACKESGIKYIHSVEIYLTENLEPKVRDNYHTILMARNMDGVKELNELVSKSFNPDHFYYTNRISFDEFLACSDNIISTSACLASPLNKLDETHPRYMQLARKYTFLEIQPHNHPDQIAFNQQLLKLSRMLDKKLIVGTDSHSSTPYKAECRAILLKAKHKSYGDEDAFDLTFKSYDELVEMFKAQNAIPLNECIQALNNTNLLDEMTEEINLDTSIKYPILYGSREKDREVFEETVSTMFKQKCDAGIIPEEQIPAFEEAIKEEMRVFEKLNMDGFMLGQSELVRWCKEQGMAIGTARGSVGGSRIAYVTDIIDLNPEQWNTVFSRFCNEDRVEPGDIDTDVVESDRPLIFKHIVERFGTRKTARVASFGTLQVKGVIDDVGRALGLKWVEEHPNESTDKNPWSLKNVAKIKSEFDSDEEATKKKYSELFYYLDGLFNTKISQSIHPAGIVISPITLPDNYGVFDKDGDICLMIDMECVHELGLVKYDWLILKTIQVIRDTCNYLGVRYPKTHEIDWLDEAVWDDMIKSPAALFQYESTFAFDSLKKFKPHSISDLSLVAAAIRPSGASYRDDLLARKPHHNPAKEIDELLKEENGYLVYQENVIQFLQKMCGYSGGEADSIRRLIARKKPEELEKAIPEISERYCLSSDKPHDVAEKEVKEFIQIIEDASSYMFGRNHACAYSLLTYLCAYYRYYHPIEFLTSFLNNAANDDDIRNGTAYANRVGIKVSMPKWGISKSDYFYDTDKKIITKGMSSIKYMSAKVSDELYSLAHAKTYSRFCDLLHDIDRETSLDRRQLDILTKLDFFSDFGNQRELIEIEEMFFNLFNKGEAKQIKKATLEGSPYEPIVQKYAVGVTKTGAVSKSYTLLDVESIIRECEGVIKQAGLQDLDLYVKARNFEEVMGYAGYVSGRPEDNRLFFTMQIYPLLRKKDQKQFGYSVIAKSIGSGKETRFTVFNSVYKTSPLHEKDIFYCRSWTREGIYFTLTGYDKIIC